MLLWCPWAGQEWWAALLVSSLFQLLENVGIAWGTLTLPICLLGAKKDMAAHSSQACGLCIFVSKTGRDCVALEAYSKYFIAFEKVDRPNPVQKENLQNSGH